MWIALALLIVLIVLGVGGFTGRGVFDSRDPGYSCRPPEPRAMPADSPGHAG
jgi:hypothetical protein